MFFVHEYVSFQYSQFPVDISILLARLEQMVRSMGGVEKVLSFVSTITGLKNIYIDFLNT